MKTLKELTWEHHKEAERQHFVKVLMSGKILEEVYAVYLYNQHQAYNILEAVAMADGFFDDMPQLRRAPEILKDFNELWTWKHKPWLCESTKKYVEYVNKNLMDNPEKIAAHIYVRHMGDLSGGQMIKRKTPGPNRYYVFKHNEAKEYKRIVKERVESYLNLYEINVLPEAIFCFESATNLFKEMYDLGPTNKVE